MLATKCFACIIISPNFKSYTSIYGHDAKRFVPLNCQKTPQVSHDLRYFHVHKRGKLLRTIYLIHIHAIWCCLALHKVSMNRCKNWDINYEKKDKSFNKRTRSRAQTTPVPNMHAKYSYFADDISTFRSKTDSYQTVSMSSSSYPVHQDPRRSFRWIFYFL
jgi:hypothetical protein